MHHEGLIICYYPAKTNLQDHARLCKNLARSCMQVLHAICPFSCTILAHSCTNSCKILPAKNVQEILAASLAKSVLRHFLQGMCKIVQESCKKSISRATRFLQDSCMILQVRFCSPVTYMSLGGIKFLSYR